jgi:hypothetical protein
MPDSRIVRWSGYEHEFVERETDWYWALAIVAICVAIVAILLHDVLFAILIILAAVVIGMLANVPPDVTEFEVSERGVRVGRDLHRYEEILAFWVEDEAEGQPILLIDTVKFMSPNIVIPIQDEVDPSELRAILREYATELPMQEPRAKRILEFFGF